MFARFGSWSNKIGHPHQLKTLMQQTATGFYFICGDPDKSEQKLLEKAIDYYWMIFWLIAFMTAAVAEFTCSFS